MKGVTKRVIFLVLALILLTVWFPSFIEAHADSQGYSFGDFNLILQKGYRRDLLCDLGQLAITDIYNQDYSIISENGFDSILPVKIGEPLFINGWFVEGCIAMKTVRDKGMLILIAFEGTDWGDGLADGILDFSTKRDIYGIHFGFSVAAQIFLGTYGDVLQNTYSQALKRYGDCQFILTGHSLGGATAQVVTYFLNKMYDIPKSKMVTYTYASPMPFQRGLFHNYGEWNNVYNLQNTADIITTVLQPVNTNIGQTITFKDKRGLTAIIPEHVDAYTKYLADLNLDVTQANTAKTYSYEWYAKILKLCMSEAFDFLGSGYEYTGAGGDGWLMGFSFNKMGITLGSHDYTYGDYYDLDYNDILSIPVDFIHCTGVAQIGDVQIGMTFQEIEDILGPPNKVFEGNEDEPDSPYLYSYNLPNIEVDFAANTSLNPTYAAFVELIN